jgi:hypothetical protein
MSADDLSDLSSRNALICDGMITARSGTLLQYEPVETSGIEPVHRWPAIEPVLYVRGNPLCSCNADKVWHEAVVAFPVYGWRKA